MIRMMYAGPPRPPETDEERDLIQGSHHGRWMPQCGNRVGRASFYCNLPRGHAGLHVAVDGRNVLCTWTDELPQLAPHDALAWARHIVAEDEAGKAAAADRRRRLEIELLRRELGDAGLPFDEPFDEPFVTLGMWKIEISGEHRLCASLPDRRYIRFPATPAGALIFAEFVIQEEGE